LVEMRAALWESGSILKEEGPTIRRKSRPERLTLRKERKLREKFFV